MVERDGGGEAESDFLEKREQSDVCELGLSSS